MCLKIHNRICKILVDDELAAQRPNTVLVQAEKDFEIRVVSEEGDVRQRFQMALIDPSSYLTLLILATWKFYLYQK